MRANSSPIISNQTDIHDQLEKLVARHTITRFLKPIAPYNQSAFDNGMAAWRAAGEPPLILDAGCGTGVSTMNLAIRFPEHFVIGVDQSADRLERNINRPAGAPCNLIKVRADLIDYWRLMQQAGIHPDRHYVLYPNPWPKKHHIGRRWHGHAVFPTMVALGGYFECRSNWRIYIDECAAALTQLTAVNVQTEVYLLDNADVLASEMDLADSSSAAITPFEHKYLASGHTLWRCRINLPKMQDQCTT